MGNIWKCIFWGSIDRDSISLPEGAKGGWNAYLQTGGEVESISFVPSCLKLQSL